MSGDTLGTASISSPHKYAFNNQENYERSYVRLWNEINELQQDKRVIQEKLDGASELIILIEEELDVGLKLQYKTFKAYEKAKGK